MNDYNSIEFLKKQFLCCTPLNRFKWPDYLNNIDTQMQKQIINATVNNDLILKLPIKESYKKAFLKQFISKLEQYGIEIDDDVYNTYCDAVASPDKHSAMHYRHFCLTKVDVNKILSIKESTNIISEGTTGLCSWKAAFSLAEWCVANREEFQGKNILELGSGVGLTGLTIINFCAPRTYYFSDCHLVVLKTLEENIRSNLLENKNDNSWKEIASNYRIQLEKDSDKKMKINVLNLNWEDINKLNFEQMEIDVVIAADVLYDSSTFESLALGLRELIYRTVNYAIIVATVRNELTISEFLNVLDKYDLAYEDETMSMSQVFIQSEDTPIRILKILRQNK